MSEEEKTNTPALRLPPDGLLEEAKPKDEPTVVTPAKPGALPKAVRRREEKCQQKFTQRQASQ